MKNSYKSLLLAALAVTALAFSCNKAEVPLTPEEKAAMEEEKLYEPGLMEIYLSEELADAVEKDLAAGGVVTRATSDELSQLYQQLGITSMERVFPYAGEYEPRTRREGLHRWYRVGYDEAVTSTRASENFSTVPGVEKAEPVRKTVLESFDDPLLYLQWHYYNDGTLSRHHDAGCDINVVPVWENYTTGDPKVIVAVNDEGVDFNHEDLAWNYVGGHNFYSTDAEVEPGDHGTHVGGTIGATNNNGIGVCGIAGGDYAKGIHGCGIYSCQSGKNNSIGYGSSGIKWGADNGAVISQNSWSSGTSGSISSTTKEAIDYFIKYAGCDNDGNQLADSPMKGGLVVFAAGNHSTDYCLPAAYEPVVAVAAIGPDSYMAYYSDWGDWVDICAPGGNLYYDNGMVQSCETDNTYNWNQGTSMACPHVSGVAALVVSYYGGPGFTPDDLKEKLIGGANYDIIYGSKEIGPLLDALGAITYGTTIAPEKVESYSAETDWNSINFTWKVTADEDDTKAYGYLLMAATDRSLIAGITSPFDNIPDDVLYLKVKTGSLAVGEELTATIDGLSSNTDTDYYVAIYAYDYAKNYSDMSEIKAVTVPANQPPVISTTYTGDYSIRQFQTVEFPILVEDPEGHSFTVEYTAGSAAETWKKNSDSDYTLTVTGYLVDAGTYTATVSATDSYSATSDDFGLTYTIIKNNAPQVGQQIEDVSTPLGTDLTYNLEDYISDPDGESLTWAASSTDESVVSTAISGSTLTVETHDYGVADVTVTGKDYMGESVSTTFNVTVYTASTEPVAYPNPVSDILYVFVPADTQATLTMHSSSGSKVYEKTVSVLRTAPAEVNVSSFAPGRYTLEVAYDGKKFTLNITKI